MERVSTVPLVEWGLGNTNTLLYIITFISACLVAQPNGVCKIMEPTNGYSSHSTPNEDDFLQQSPCMPMPPGAELLKNKAHRAFNAQDFTTALELYNQAIQMYDNVAHLYSARAATLIKRKWWEVLYQMRSIEKYSLLVGCEELIGNICDFEAHKG